MRLGLVLAGILAWVGCAPRHFSLLRHEGRDYLLPPGMRQPPSVQPETECVSGVTPRASHFGLYGCYPQTGFVDLQPGMRLKIVKPKVAEGETLKAEVLARQGLNLTVKTNATGVEMQFLDVRPSVGGVSVDVGFDAGITHYRLFFLARQLEQAGRKITLIGAPSRQDLDAASKSLDAYCSRPRAACLAVSDGTVIGPEIGVRVNGKPSFVPLGAAAREVTPAGIDPARVRVTRAWRGKPAPVRATGDGVRSILQMPLNGGDTILW